MAKKQTAAAGKRSPRGKVGPDVTFTHVTHPIPAVGRVVHYCANADLVPHAALISAGSTDPFGEVVLTVFGPEGTYRVSAKHAAQPSERCWSWPPRVEDYIEAVELVKVAP